MKAKYSKVLLACRSKFGFLGPSTTWFEEARAASAAWSQVQEEGKGDIVQVWVGV